MKSIPSELVLIMIIIYYDSLVASLNLEYTLLPSV